jgi:hypothetical protein
MLVSQSDLPQFDWTESQFTSTASSSTTVLQFGFRDDPDYLLLDDVSVFPLPGSGSTVAAPVIQSVERVGQTIVITWSAVSGQVYQVQSTANLAQGPWADLGSTITATATTVTVSEPIGTSGSLFYRIVLMP